MRAYTLRYANKRENSRRGFHSVKSLPMTILLTGLLLSGAFSCATAAKGPVAASLVRLLSIDVLGSGIKGNSSFVVNIFFEAGDKTEIKKACFYGLGEGLSCFDVAHGT